MRRGEIRWVALDHGDSRQAKAQRPAVIVSNDGANAAAARRGAGVVTVVPLTTSAAAAQPFQVILPAGVGGLPRDAKALAEHVRTVGADRLGPSIGTVPLVYLRRIDDALRLHLGL
jgi:mRNA interferase MazF